MGKAPTNLPLFGGVIHIVPHKGFVPGGFGFRPLDLYGLCANGWLSRWFLRMHIRSGEKGRELSEVARHKELDPAVYSS